jgi:hypothetical protein
MWGQAVQFDGALLEIGPRLGGVAAYHGHPGNEARTETVVIRLDEIRTVRFPRASPIGHGRLELMVTPRPDETATPLWWAGDPTAHPRIASIALVPSQQASFEALRDAIRRALTDQCT